MALHWAARRRAIILLIIFAFISVFMVIPYLILTYEAPSCVDGKRNQDETGVDCGGVCTRLCTGEAIPLAIKWTRVYPVRDGVYDVVAYIENRNFKIGATNIPYELKVYDRNDTVIAERTGALYARPNEHLLLFEGTIRTGDRVPERAEVSIKQDFTWEKTGKKELPLIVKDKSVTDSLGKPKLSATVEHTGVEILRDIDVAAIVYDRNNIPIGVSTSRIERILPGTQEQIYFTWSLPFNYDPELESCEQPVDVILALDRSGSMQSDSKDPPQPLTAAKDAAIAFLDRLTPQDQAGYVSFATEATNPIDELLTPRITSVKEAVDNTFILTGSTQYTNIGDAIARARDEFLSGRPNPDAKQVLVLLTDGVPTYPKDPNEPEFPVQYARSAANEIKSEEVNVYTIGLGEELNEDLLREMATKPEQYYNAASGAELGGIYQAIASSICKKGPSVIEIIPRINDVGQTPAN